MGLGPGLRFAGRGITGLNFAGLSRGLKNYGTRSWGLKIFRDTVPVPCRLLVGIRTKIFGTVAGQISCGIVTLDMSGRKARSVPGQPRDIFPPIASGFSFTSRRKYGKWSAPEIKRKTFFPKNERKYQQLRLSQTAYFFNSREFPFLFQKWSQMDHFP